MQIVDVEINKGNSRLKEIIINNSPARIIRAGFANLLIPLTLIFNILIAKLLSDSGVPLYIIVVVLLIVTFSFVKVYLSNVSKVVINSDSMIFTTPLFVKLLEKVRNVKIYTIPSSRAAFIIIKVDGQYFPVLFMFVTTQTNVGNFNDTVDELNRLVKKTY